MHWCWQPLFEATIQSCSSRCTCLPYNHWFLIVRTNSADSIFGGSLQVNIGMIAACVPSLKPLVSKALKLSDYTNSNSRRYENHSSRHGSRYAGQSRSTEWNDPYALEELHSNEDENGSNVVRSNPTGHNSTATFYQSGSEEMILNNRDSNNVPQEILMTTEFNVH